MSRRIRGYVSKNGREPIVPELTTVARKVPVQWKKARIDVKRISDLCTKSALSTRQIAQKLGISKTSVIRILWVEKEN